MMARNFIQTELTKSLVQATLDSAYYCRKGKKIDVFPAKNTERHLNQLAFHSFYS